MLLPLRLLLNKRTLAPVCPLNRPSLEAVALGPIAEKAAPHCSFLLKDYIAFIPS